MASAEETSSSRHVERRVQEIGREIFAQTSSVTPRVLRAEWWEQHLLEWAMHDDRLRAQLFRFIDVLPMLHTGAAVAAHLRAYLLDGSVALPPALETALHFDSVKSVAARIAAFAARRQVRQIARRFIAGETLEEAKATVQRLRAQRMSFTIDVLGEAVTSERQADDYAVRYVELIEGLASTAKAWPALAPIDTGPAGSLPRVNVSLKLSALDSRFDAMAPERSLAVVSRRLREVLRAARRCGAFVYVDMEEYASKDLLLHIFRSILMEGEFRDFAHAGIVIQTYLPDAPRDLAALIDWARARGCPIAIRLVKGAYWDTETVHAVQRGWPCPVLTQKWETDAAFERLTAVLMQQHAYVRPAIASHNVRSLSNALALAEHYGLTAQDFEVQMLFGMGDPLKAALVERGLHVRIYTPYGPLLPGMAYLIRRLLENTSNDSFLRQSFTEHVAVDELLAAPERSRPRSSQVPQPVAVDAGGIPAAAFANEGLTDFTIASHREEMAAAIRELRARHAGKAYPLIIGSRRVAAQQYLESIDPSRPTFIVGRAACATVGDADAAVEAARAAWPAWRSRLPGERAHLLRRIADRLRARRFELAAWMVLESGKPWREADADVVEAIDYCTFYAREVERRQPARQRWFPGEENALLYEPCGVAAVIAPWNFPLAILTGMTLAALVTGNTAVVKPAEQSPVIAAKLFEIFEEVGLPAGVANFLPGSGEEIGAHLVQHPEVAVIAFTGSRAVGVQILEAAARLAPGQRRVKRVIAEMGGKNAIIVDSDADLDAAVSGVVASAFGYAGQKCSAAARVIVVESIHAVFLKRLIESTRSVTLGPADEPATFIPPLIDAAARARVLDYIEKGRREAELVCHVEPPAGDGYFVGPAIFDRVPIHASIAQEEIFGPVLCVLVAESFDDALAVANDSDYGLTGGLYSRDPAHIEAAKRGFHVGTLYVNRAITGAIVDRQPFGGCKLSGIGSKAGGPDYLLQFCEAKTVCENTLRHGFAPGPGRF